MSGPRQSGFTLLEVLIAMALLAFMMTLVWTTTTSTVDVKRDVETMQARQSDLRIAMNRLVHDIQSAYLSKNEITNLDNPRTLFVGKSSRPVDELRFSSLGHRVLWAEANESEQTLISYSSERDPDDPGKTNLIRRESRRLSNEPWESEPAEVDVLLRGIERVEFEYFNWDDNDWQDHWDSTKTDAERNKLPERVRITVTYQDGDDEVKRTTQARIPMQEMLDSAQGLGGS